MVVGRGVRPEGEFVLLGRAAEEIEDAARLHSRALVCGIEFEDVAHELGEVQDNGDVAALAGQAGATAAPEHGGAVPAGGRDCLDNVFLVPRDDDADRHLPVIRGVRRIQCTAPVIEAHLTADLAAELRLQRPGINLGDIGGPG